MIVPALFLSFIFSFYFLGHVARRGLFSCIGRTKLTINDKAPFLGLLPMSPHDFAGKWYTIDTWQILDAVATVPNCTKILTLSASGRSNDTNIQIFCAEQAFCTENLNFLAITFFNFKKK